MTCMAAASLDQTDMIGGYYFVFLFDMNLINKLGLTCELTQSFVEVFHLPSISFLFIATQAENENRDGR